MGKYGVWVKCEHWGTENGEAEPKLGTEEEAHSLAKKWNEEEAKELPDPYMYLYEVRAFDPEAKPYSMPWDAPELHGWSIVGMNHYYQKSEGVKSRHLFVAMTNKYNHCIVAEGSNEAEVWLSLCKSAHSFNKTIKALNEMDE